MIPPNPPVEWEGELRTPIHPLISEASEWCEPRLPYLAYPQEGTLMTSRPSFIRACTEALFTICPAYARRMRGTEKGDADNLPVADS